MTRRHFKSARELRLEELCLCIKECEANPKLIAMRHLKPLAELKAYAIELQAIIDEGKAQDRWVLAQFHPEPIKVAVMASGREIRPIWWQDMGYDNYIENRKLVEL